MSDYDEEMPDLKETKKHEIEKLEKTLEKLECIMPSYKIKSSNSFWCKKRLRVIKERLKILKNEIKIKEINEKDDEMDIDSEEDDRESGPFPLTREQQIKIDAICSRTDEESIVINKFKNPIQVKDLQNLKPKSLLNDKVINFYMDLISERSKENTSLPTVYSFSTFFVERFLKDGYKGVRRYTKKTNLFSYDMILIPENINNDHWCMIIINLNKKTIGYYDSFGDSHDFLLHSLAKYLEEESMDKRKVAYDTSEFLIETVADMPQQKNHYDCGVFACMAAEYVARCQPLNFTQEDMPNLRAKMILEISSGRLLLGTE